jgi:hypothetical protein
MILVVSLRPELVPDFVRDLVKGGRQCDIQTTETCSRDSRHAIFWTNKALRTESAKGPSILILATQPQFSQIYLHRRPNPWVLEARTRQFQGSGLLSPALDFTTASPIARPSPCIRHFTSSGRDVGRVKTSASNDAYIECCKANASKLVRNERRAKRRVSGFSQAASLEPLAFQLTGCALKSFLRSSWADGCCPVKQSDYSEARILLSPTCSYDEGDAKEERKQGSKQATS